MSGSMGLIFRNGPSAVSCMPQSSAKTILTKPQDGSFLYNFSMEEAAQQFSEIPGNKKLEDSDHHSDGM